MKILYVIPARGGSKRVPGKNIKPLNGKPLICYSIDIARQLTQDNNICVSTDDDEIIKTVENYGLKVPFKRPANLATDEATTNDVLLHAVQYYETKGCYYDSIVLLQPTSPFRKVIHVKEALTLYNEQLDIVVSVKRSNVASLIVTENARGYLEFCFNADRTKKRKVTEYFEYNGAIYIINIERLKKIGLDTFSKKKKYLMDDLSSHDIDTKLDWLIAEKILEKNLIRYSK